MAVNINNLGARALSPLAGGLPLRIMPLGASITYGQASSDGNGYREALRSQLVEGGNAVNMVGSRQHGTMHDNNVEGWPGAVIETVHSKAQTSVPQYKPNVVLINAGTNDCLGNLNMTGVGDRMQSLIDEVWNLSPKATVVLSSLLVNKGPAAERNVLDANAQFAAVATKLQAQGRHVVFVDMHTTDGPLASDLVDSTHPNDAGYRKMAAIWYAGLVEASNAGWIVPADPVPGLKDDGSI